MIRLAKLWDAPLICAIYNYFIENTTITFEEHRLDNAQMQERLQQADSRYPWLVYEVPEGLAGYAYISPWKSRSAYRFTVESTIYLSPQYCGQGIGGKLYHQLIESAYHNGFHSIIGGIALPNESSIRLHEKLGFVKTAHFNQVGFKHGRWIDVGYWQLALNQRD